MRVESQYESVAPTDEVLDDPGPALEATSVAYGSRASSNLPTGMGTRWRATIDAVRSTKERAET